MIIDLILDRKFDMLEGRKVYNAKEFYNSVYEYRDVFPTIADKITYVMDYGTEKDVKKSLCDYIITQEYNPQLCDFINSVNWLENDGVKEYTK